MVVAGMWAYVCLCGVVPLGHTRWIGRAKNYKSNITIYSNQPIGFAAHGTIPSHRASTNENEEGKQSTAQTIDILSCTTPQFPNEHNCIQKIHCTINLLSMLPFSLCVCVSLSTLRNAQSGAHFNNIFYFFHIHFELDIIISPSMTQCLCIHKVLFVTMMCSLLTHTHTHTNVRKFKPNEGKQSKAKQIHIL